MELQMRVAETLEYKGYFWLPEQGVHKAPGTLQISDGGDIILEIVGSFSGPTGSHKDIFSDVNIGRVVGQIEKAGAITLDGCYFKKRNYAFGGIAKSEIKASQAILGVEFDLDEEILFDSINVSIEGFAQWVGQTGISHTFPQDFKSFEISYKVPSGINLISNDGFSIDIRFGHSVPMGVVVGEAKITENIYVKITENEQKDLRLFAKTASRFRDFLSFALDETIQLHDVSARNTSITIELHEGKTKPAEMQLYFRTSNFLERRPKLDRHRMLFRYGDIAENSAAILGAWFSLYETIAPVMGLYFSTKAGAHKFLEGRFLALAQALETLHRRTSNETAMAQPQFDELKKALVDACPPNRKEWLEQRLAYGNEISLSRRIKSLMKPFTEQFGDKASRQKFSRTLVETRNYLTHYDKKLETKAASGTALWAMCERMEALLQLHLLKSLGFTDDQIKAISAGSLKNKLKIGN